MPWKKVPAYLLILTQLLSRDSACHYTHPLNVVRFVKKNRGTYEYMRNKYP